MKKKNGKRAVSITKRGTKPAKKRRDAKPKTGSASTIQKLGTRVTARGDRVTIANVALTIPDGVLIVGDKNPNGDKETHGKPYSSSDHHSPVKMKLLMSKDDLSRLVFMFNTNRSIFCQTVAKSVIYPAITFLNQRTNARGKSKGKEASQGWLKLEAAELYRLFAFIIKHGRRPPFFLKLINEIDKSENSLSFYNVGKSGIKKPNPLALAAYCVEKYSCLCGNCLHLLGVTSFLHKIKNNPNENDSDSQSAFYHNYIRGAEPWYDYSGTITDAELEIHATEQSPFSEIFGAISCNTAAPCPLKDGEECPSDFLREGRIVLINP